VSSTVQRSCSGAVVLRVWTRFRWYVLAAQSGLHWTGTRLPRVSALPNPGLDRIGGLDGVLREWWVQPQDGIHVGATEGSWRAVPIRNDFGLWPRRDPRLAPFIKTGMRLRAQPVATRATRATLVLNTFARYRLLIDGRLVAAPLPKSDYAFGDLRHEFDVEAGGHEIVIEIDAGAVTLSPSIFAARLLPSAAFRIAPAGAVDDDAEAFRYYEARSTAPACPRDSWTTHERFALWRDEARAVLRRLMPSPPVAEEEGDLSPRVVERVEFDDHVRETVSISVEPGWRTEVHVLVPRGRGDGPWPGLLCLHGHGKGKDDLVGEDRGDPARRATIDALNEDYALRYVRRGYVTAVPSMRLLADRGLPRDSWKQTRRDVCDNGFVQAILCGAVPAALDAWDSRRTLDLLETRPEVARDQHGARLGCVGLSYGGRAAMFVTALDERIRAVVVSGAMNCFRERLISFASCGSQFVPGLFAIGDTTEILATIAPRPLLMELGSRDETSPAIFAEHMSHTLTRAYEAAGVPERLAFDVFEGEHRFSGRVADGWLERWIPSG